MSKIISIAGIKKTAGELKRRGKTLVFTNGCFDLIHPGHIKILRDAKKKGDVLIVGLNSDASIRCLKGACRPVLDESARAQVLAAISYVDYVVIFAEDTPYELIKAIRPQVLVKGEDWKASQIVGRDIARKIVRIKFYPGYSTTAIINKIRNAR